MTIAEEVRALRSALSENTAAFGARWRKSGRTVEGWEQGRTVPDAFVRDSIRQLARTTGHASAAARTRKKQRTKGEKVSR
jgi:DNA-binding transcriptional regulator YiaG